MFVCVNLTKLLWAKTLFLYNISRKIHRWVLLFRDIFMGDRYLVSNKFSVCVDMLLNFFKRLSSLITLTFAVYFFMNHSITLSAI